MLNNTNDAAKRQNQAIRDAARQYKARGWKPIPMREGEKRPIGAEAKDWQIKDIPVMPYHRNVGVQFGACSGGLCDVDIDCREAMGLAAYFLPETGAVFGRESNPKSHWLYVTTLHETAEQATTQYTDPTRQNSEDVEQRKSAMLVELRTGRVERKRDGTTETKGALSMFPPSIHPTGEQVRWDEDGEPGRPENSELQECVALLATAALLVRHYPGEGRRQRAALVLGGVLARARWDAEKITKFVGVVAEDAGDEQWSDRAKSAAGAVKLLQRDSNCPGLPRMCAEWGEAITNRVAEWLGLGGWTAAAPETDDRPARERSNRRLPVIECVPGRIAAMVDEAHDALLDANLRIFTRVDKLVRPRERDHEAAHGRTTTRTLFVPLDEHKVSYLLNLKGAKFVRPDGRSRKMVPCDPPAKVAATLLALGEWKFPEVIGIVSAPTLRPDGSILSKYGYDAQTRLWCNSKIKMPAIPDKPTRAQAEQALKLFTDLLAGFPFVNEVDRSVALSAIMTAVLRGAFVFAPMVILVAPEPGTGKSYFVDLLANIVTARDCPVIAASDSVEEMDKRLGSILLEGGSLISLDNLSGDLQAHKTLCQMLTQQFVKVRILGVSETPECEWRGTMLATGNNIRVGADLIRRTLVANLDAKTERPELRKFSFNPVDRVLGDRGAYIAAAIIISRAYAVSGEAVTVAPLNGYEDWCRFVREPLVWLGQQDPVQAQEKAREQDPERAAAYELVTYWSDRIGINKAVAVSDIIKIANALKDSRNNSSRDYRYPKFRTLLVEVAGTRGDAIDPRRLGRWLRGQSGRILGEHRLDLVVRRGMVNKYKLTQVETR